MLSTRQSPVPELQGISEEDFVLCKALTQTSSWVSCDSNPIICSSSLPTRYLPNMLIHLNTPTYFTVRSVIFKEKRLTCGMVFPYIHTRISQMLRHIEAYTAHTCAHFNSNPFSRGELREGLFLCISGLPVWIREKAALPPLNVSWCLPGCLFWEQIKGRPLPLAPTKGEKEKWGGAKGVREGNMVKQGEWMSFHKTGLTDRFSDGCFDGWIQTYITLGSYPIYNAYVLLPFMECCSKILLLQFNEITFIRCGYRSCVFIMKNFTGSWPHRGQNNIQYICTFSVCV